MDIRVKKTIHGHSCENIHGHSCKKKEAVSVGVTQPLREKNIFSVPLLRRRSVESKGILV